MDSRIGAFFRAKDTKIFCKSKGYSHVQLDIGYSHVWACLSILVGGAITILKNMSSSAGRVILYTMENSFNPSEKYEFVSWDDDIPNMMGKKKTHVPNHQPVIVLTTVLFFKFAASPSSTMLLLLPPRLPVGRPGENMWCFLHVKSGGCLTSTRCESHCLYPPVI